MAVLPVSSLDLEKNSVSFGKKRQTKNNVTAPNSNPSASKLAAVPIVVMLTMNPSLLNAYDPETVNGLNSNKEIPALVINPEQVNNIEAPQLPKVSRIEDLPEIKAYLNENKNFIIKKIPTKANGKDAIIVYEDYSKTGKQVNTVSLLTSDFKNYDYLPNNVRKPITAPEILTIIYHDLGEDKEYCSVATFNVRYKYENGHNKRYNLYKEYRISDEAANELLALTINKSYSNLARVKFEETKNSNLAPDRITY